MRFNQSEELMRIEDVAAGKIALPKGIRVIDQGILWAPNQCADEKERDILFDFAKRIVGEIPAKIEAYTDLRIGCYLAARNNHPNALYAGWLVQLTSYRPFSNRVFGQQLQKKHISQESDWQYDLDDLVKQITLLDTWVVMDKRQLGYCLLHTGIELESFN